MLTQTITEEYENVPMLPWEGIHTDDGKKWIIIFKNLVIGVSREDLESLSNLAISWLKAIDAQNSEEIPKSTG